MFKRILLSSLAALVIVMTASCTELVVNDQSSNGDISKAESSVVDAPSKDVSSDISISESPSEEVSEEVSYDTELVIPTTITSNPVDSFFDGSIFVGNSIMLKYRNFANKYRTSSVKDFLGNSEFFCGGSFGVYHNNHTPASKEGSVNPTYKGEKYSVQDLVGVANPKRILINLAGLNDMGIFPVDSCAQDTAKEMIQLIKDIKTKYPNVEVVVLSTTYMIKSWNSMARLNNENLSVMNNLVLDYCNANGVDFVDISSALVGDNGCLADEYCSDPDSGGCHLTDSGCLVWTGLLRNYAAKKLNNTYKNPESMPTLSKG